MGDQRAKEVPPLVAGLVDQPAEQQVVERDVQVQGHGVGVHHVLDGEPDVESDHRGRQLIRRKLRLAPDLVVRLAYLTGEQRSVAAPEGGRELSKPLVPCGLSEALEPEPEEPAPLLVRLHVLPPPKDPRAVRYIAFALLLIAIAALVVYLLR